MRLNLKLGPSSAFSRPALPLGGAEPRAFTPGFKNQNNGYPKNRGSCPSDCSFSGKRPIFKHDILVYSGKRPNNTTALRLGATE